jgi:hypothetical protein
MTGQSWQSYNGFEQQWIWNSNNLSSSRSITANQTTQKHKSKPNHTKTQKQPAINFQFAVINPHSF